MRLPHEENDAVLINSILMDNSRHIFDLLHKHLIQYRHEDLVLESYRSHLFQDIPGGIFEIYAIVFVEFFEDYLILGQLFLNVDILLIGLIQVSDFYLL